MIGAKITAMNTGHKASAVLHGGLILWVMLFDLFSPPDRDMTPAVADVSLVSAEEFAALSAPRAAMPEPAPTPVAPPPRPVPPPAPEPEPAAEPVAPPAPVTPPPPEPAPAPEPEPEPEPAPAPPAPPEPPSPPQAEVIAPAPTPDASLRPIQRPADRVAPTPAPTPAPDVAIDRRDQAAAEPDEQADPAEAPPAQEETQRAPAATETVTEATRIDEDEAPRRTATAPEVSMRPRARPERAPTETATATPDPAPQPQAPAPAPAPTPAPTQPTGPSSDAIADALAAAMADEPTPGSGLEDGPAISQADIDGLRLAVEECWNVGILSSDALQVVVTIGFEMSPDSRPVPGTIRLIEAQGGGQAAQMTAFEAGRRAIEECGMNGYGLPSELYDQWRLVEITFNPARMSSR